ncbi:MAG: YncE family protein, partial [Thermoplasmata archaeon]|nr:YncE family protein [Thermoplasmata archaeon]
MAIALLSILLGGVAGGTATASPGTSSLGPHREGAFLAPSELLASLPTGSGAGHGTNAAIPSCHSSVDLHEGLCAASSRRAPEGMSGGANSTPVPELGTTLGTVGVGNDPFGIAFDPANGYLYSANLGGGTVSVVNRTTVVASISVGGDPFSVAYNPLNGYIYVTDSLDGTVLVISGTTVIKTISVLSSPQGIAVDPGSGLVYV